MGLTERASRVKVDRCLAQVGDMRSSEAAEQRVAQLPITGGGQDGQAAIRYATVGVDVSDRVVSALRSRIEMRVIAATVLLLVLIWEM